MKKLILFLLTVVMTMTTLALLAACGGDETTVPAQSSTPAADEPTGSSLPAESSTTPAETSTEAPTTTESPYVGVEVANPVATERTNDPWVIEHDGHYYYCFQGGAGGRAGVCVAEIPSIDQLSKEGASQVYLAPTSGMYSKEYWAPELHYINGEWYIYVAADDGNNANHRMYVLKGTSQDPTEPFEMVGKITDPTDKWAIDGTVLQYKGELYFIWSGWPGNSDGTQLLYIAHMSDPTTIDSERVRISSPTQYYEKNGMPLNEGPCALVHDDDVFIFFSASGSWTDNYCISYLKLVGDDPMDPQSWSKSPKPLISQRVGVAYGPGHCSIAPAPDGSLWIIFHANLEKGSGWEGRSGWILPLTFDENGNPVVGRLSSTVTFPHVKNE